MNVRSYFPLNANVRRQELSTLILCIVIYLIISAVAGLAASLLGWIPVVGWVVDVVAWLIGVYCLAGIVLAILDYLKH